MRSYPRVVASGLVLLAASLLAVLGSSCSTQPAYPSKAIELTVAFPPGGAGDLVGRTFAKYMSPDLGVPVNVVNKAGGNQIPGVLSVLNAPADGYTLLFETQGNSSLHGIVPDLPYKLEDRTFGPMMAEGPQAYVVNGKSPWNSLKDVMDAAKKDPGSFTWARLGGTTIGDFSSYQLFNVAGVETPKTKAVAFDGAGPAVTAVAGGHVLFSSAGASSVMSLRSSGDLKVLAVTSDKRLTSLPDVPTTKEAGFPGVDLIVWWGFSGPKGLAKGVMDRLDASAKKITADASFAKDLQGIAAQPKYMAPDQTRDYVFKEVETFKTLAAKFQK